LARSARKNTPGYPSQEEKIAKLAGIGQQKYGEGMPFTKKKQRERQR